MRYVAVLSCLLIVLSGCSTQLTGLSVSDDAPTTPKITYTSLTESEPHAVRILIRSELVASEVFVGEQSYVLTGDVSRQDFFEDQATLITYLDAGEYLVSATVCTQQLFSRSCEDISRTIRVPR